MSTIATVKTLRKSLRFCMGVRRYLLTHSGARSCAMYAHARGRRKPASAGAAQPQRGDEQRARQQAGQSGKQAGGHREPPIATDVPDETGEIYLGFITAVCRLGRMRVRPDTRVSA